MAIVLILPIFKATYLIDEEITEPLQQNYNPSRGVIKLGMTPDQTDGVKQRGD